MVGKMRQTMVLSWFTVMVLLGFADVARAQVFQPMDAWTTEFSTIMQSRVARALGLIGMATLLILGITTRGHGMEIGIAAVVLGFGLFMMFSADRIFQFFGYTQ